TVTKTASSSRFQQREAGEPGTSSTPAITFLIQEALISGGLGALAQDSSFLAVTRDEMAASSQLEVDEVEKAAVELLKGRRETQQGTKTGSAPLDTSAVPPGRSPGLGAAPSQKTITATRL
ncbi:CAC1S protein, partial [Prunella fulvescens]|nr:CAC1S protein [Prunella fulvescens]